MFVCGWWAQCEHCFTLWFMYVYCVCGVGGPGCLKPLEMNVHSLSKVKHNFTWLI